MHAGLQASSFCMQLGMIEWLLQVLVVKNGSHIFREFSTREASYQFWRRIKHITGIWCCTYDGGVAYNMIPKSLPKKTSPT